MYFKKIAQGGILPVLREYMQGSEHPDLQVYRQGVFDDAAYMEVWQSRLRDFCKLGNFCGKRVLEVGCGFGWDAVGIALTGNNEVVASDILPSMIEGMTECLDSMKKKGVELPITPLQGDICKLNLPPASFDGIFSTEAIEHVHDLPLMFRNCYRLLKPGGTVVIVNDCNQYNADACAHSWESWADRDGSWDHVEWLKKEVRPVEHADAKPYGVMREEAIRKADPTLSEANVAKLRAATAGMIYPEIEKAVRLFRTDVILPKRDEFAWCRNPETGEYSERLMDPWELKAWLEDAGFKVKLRHLFRKFPLRLLNGLNFKPLNKLLFARRAVFVLVAKKD